MGLPMKGIRVGTAKGPVLGGKVYEMFRWIRLSTVFLLIMFVTPGHAQEKASTASAKIPAPVATYSRTKTATDDPNYLIGAQDVLDISVW